MASSHLDPSNSSESSVSSGQEKSNWEDVEADTEELEFLSLFDEEKFPDVNLMLQYCKEKHHFDFVKVQGGLSSSPKAPGF
jgi:protein arginine N-methyltransferase 3